MAFVAVCGGPLRRTHGGRCRAFPLAGAEGRARPTDPVNVPVSEKAVQVPDLHARKAP